MVARSAVRTQASGSAHVQVYTTAHRTGVTGETVTLWGAGDIAYKPVQEHYDFRYSAPFAHASGTAEAVLKDNILYQRWPEFSDRIPDGKAWIAQNMTRIGLALGINYGGILNGASTSNPFQMLTFLRGTSQLQPVSHSVIDGVRTTSYSGEWDYTKLLRAHLITLEGLKLLRGQVSNPTPFRVWIDRRGLVRQLIWRREYLSDYDQPVTEISRFRYSNFGEQVSVAAPASWDVYDATGRTITLSRIGS